MVPSRFCLKGFRKNPLLSISLLLGMGVCGVGFSLEAEELRDPFMFGPRQSIDSQAQALLTGILWDMKSPLALVDGEPVRLGQRVGTWQVIAIQPDSIVVEQGLRRETVRTGDRLPAD